MTGSRAAGPHPAPRADLVFVLILVTLMVPFQVTLIPVFIELFHFGWLNTYQGLIIPRASSAFGVLLFRQPFVTIPRGRLRLRAAILRGGPHDERAEVAR